MDRDRDRLVSRRLGLSFADVLIGVAAASLLLALLYPTFRAWRFRALVEGVVSEVEALRIAAVRTYARTGVWPDASGPGAMPPGVAGAFGGDTTLVREGYALHWSTWEVVEEAEVPANVAMIPADTDAPPDSVAPPTMTVVRSVGGIVVHTSRDALLAELLTRYGRAISFVRDTTWTLVVPRPDDDS